MFRSALVTLLLFASACSSLPTEKTPAGALSLFLEAMGEATDDPSARRRAYALLAPETRHLLTRRARLAGALSARQFEPWEMIVEGRYRLRFRPREVRGFEARVDGDRAIVVVHGEQPSERAEVPMVRESGNWRVYLDVPDIEATRGGSTPRMDAGVASP